MNRKDVLLPKRLDRLFQPIEVGGLRLKNRIKLPAMGIAFEEDATVSEQTKAFYAERAKGGVGLIGVSCSATRLDRGPLYGIYDDRFLPGLTGLVDVIHAGGAKAYAQMGVGYSWAFGDGPVEFISPSGITPSGHPGSAFRLGGPREPTMPRALSVEDIHAMGAAFGDGALRARQAGFDAVEVIASVSYVVSQFLSPITNKRTDEYGGSLKNRMRFLLEIVDAIRAKAGKDFPVTCRLSGADLMEPSGYGLEDTKRMARMLEEAGVCQIDVMSGWHYASVPIIQTWVPQGAWVHLAEGVKEAVTIPVAAGTQIQDPLVAERVLAEGKADMVYMARALVADPELPNKAREGRFGQIRPCINCCRCISAVDSPPVYCSVNPRAGREMEYPEERPAETNKKVVVVGGGPAGMEAARIASLRGHTVTLCDAGPRLGGALLLAAITNRRLDPLLKYMTRETRKLPIDIRLNTRCTPSLVDEMAPDVLVLAPGGASCALGIAGEDGDNVLDRRDMQAILTGRFSAKGPLGQRIQALAGQRIVRTFYNPSLLRWLLRFGFPFKKRVAILGGGFAGCELAETLVDRGKTVTVIEPSGRIGADVEITHRWILMRKLRDAGVRLIKEARVTAITGKGVEIVQRDGVQLIQADTVVKASPAANPEFESDSFVKVAEVHRVGDAAEPAKLMEAVASGFLVGQKL